jgi:membrane dipeptidase
MRRIDDESDGGGKRDMILVDSHLDIAFNHFCFGRDPRDSALATREREGEKSNEPWRGACMVGLPELIQARVAILFSTIFLAPDSVSIGAGNPEAVTYGSPEEAERLGELQLEFYRRLVEDDHSVFRLVGSARELDLVLETWKNGAVGRVGMIPLLEGADPIRDPEDVPRWFERGLRIVGLAWRRTRYSGGTGEPGPLTAAGRELVPALAEAGMILDLSHAAEESFVEALDLSSGSVIASHSNPRALCPGDRQLSDAMIRALASRGGVIGIVPFNRQLVPDWADSGRPPVPMSRVADAIQHVADVAGTHEAVAIGSDFDGGFGAEAAPTGLDTIADLPRLADPLSDLGFSDDAIRDVLGENWIRFLRRSLPSA